MVVGIYPCGEKRIEICRILRDVERKAVYQSWFASKCISPGIKNKMVVGIVYKN